METELTLSLGNIILKGEHSDKGLCLTVKSGMPSNPDEQEEITKNLISLAHTLQHIFPTEVRKEKGLYIGLYYHEEDEAYECRVRCHIGRGEERDSWTYDGRLTITRRVTSSEYYTGEYYSENIYFSQDLTEFGSKMYFSIPFSVDDESPLPSDEDFE